MNLDELRSVQSKERRKDSLQQLRDSFYQDVAAYIEDLRARRDRRAQQVDNPFSDDEVRRLSDELETAEEVAEALYERRVGKVVKLASFAAADMSASEEGMTVEEQELFDDLVTRIRQNKTNVLAVLSGSETPTETTADSGSPTTAAEIESQQHPMTASATSEEPTTIGDPTATTSQPADETAEEDVLASAMGGSGGQPAADEAATPTDSQQPEAPPTQPQEADETPADNNGLSTTDDGMPTTDGGSTQPATPAQNATTADTAPTPSQTQSAETPTSEATTTETAAGSAEPATPEQTESTAVGQTTTESPTQTTPAQPTESPSQPAGQSAEAIDPSAETASPRPSSPQSAEQQPTNPQTTTEPQPADSSPATASEPDATTAEQSDAESLPRTTVRITESVGAIFGVDEREYKLEKEDIVMLPTANAKPLIEQDAARRLD